MPVTRGRARLNVSQEERIEQELAQKLPNAQEEREEQEEQEEQEEEDHQMSTEVEAPGADIRNMAKQLTKTLKHLLTTHRQLVNDAGMIQAGIDELHRMQKARAEHIVGRLKNASSTILTFGEVKPEARPERDEGDNEEDGYEEDDIEEKIFK